MTQYYILNKDGTNLSMNVVLRKDKDPGTYRISYDAIISLPQGDIAYQYILKHVRVKCGIIKSVYDEFVQGNGISGEFYNRLFNVNLSAQSDGTQIIFITEIIDVDEIIKNAFEYTLPCMAYLQYANNVYLDPSNGNYVPINHFNPPSSCEDYIDRINVINTPNVNVMYSPVVLDISYMRNDKNKKATLFIPPNPNNIFYVTEFVDIFGEIFRYVNNEPSKTYNIVSPDYDTSKLTVNDIQLPSYIAYVMLRVEVIFSDPTSCSNSLNFMKGFTLDMENIQPSESNIIPYDGNVRSSDIDIVEYYTAYCNYIVQHGTYLPYFQNNLNEIGIRVGKYINIFPNKLHTLYESLK